MSDFADISHHNGSVNLSVYKASGHDRFALKASEDTGFVDSAFSNRWAEGGRLGLARMPYHFLRNHSSGTDQFKHFNSVVPSLGKRDMMVLDVEDIDTPGDAAAQTIAFCKAAVSAGYTRGIIYTYKFYANDRSITAGMLPAGWRQLWLADYKSAVLDKNIVLPNGWTRTQVVARQFTDKALVPGIGLSDYNRVYRDWLTAGPPPPIKDGIDMADLDDIRRIFGLEPGQNFKLSVYGQNDNAQALDRIVNTQNPDSVVSRLDRLEAAVTALSAPPGGTP